MVLQVDVPVEAHNVTPWNPSNSNVKNLPKSPLFSGSRVHESSLSYEDSVQLSLQRSRAIVRAHNLSIDDVANLTPRFWKMHLDPCLVMDSGCISTIAVQVNLVAGSLSMHLKDRPSLAPFINSILRFDEIGLFMLTEVGYGLDVPGIKTTATLLPSGEFDLHTPIAAAAKMMPQSNPVGLKATAIVFAQLIVDGEKRGICPFIVPINNGISMHEGVTSRLLPPRGGSTPVNHAITSFNHVKLPSDALLGSGESLKPGRDIAMVGNLSVLWRPTVGTVTLGSTALPALARAAYIMGTYSQLRTMSGPRNTRFPIISFRTQQIPFLFALSHYFVGKELWNVITRAFSDPNTDTRVRRAYGTVLKATVMHQAQNANLELSERCGVRGLYGCNDIIAQWATLAGACMAEGQVLALCIRVSADVLAGRYSLPPPTNPSSNLAQHEISLYQQHRKTMSDSGGFKNADAFAKLISPHCESFIRAIGCRMAYEAALKANVDSRLLDLYELSALREGGWYAQRFGQDGAKMQAARENEAVNAAYPSLNQWLEELNVEDYCQVPIISEKNWGEFIEGLPTFNAPSRAKL